MPGTVARLCGCMVASSGVHDAGSFGVRTSAEGCVALAEGCVVHIFLSNYIRVQGVCRTSSKLYGENWSNLCQDGHSIRMLYTTT